MTTPQTLALAGRQGYDSHFLARAVKLPALAPDQQADAVQLIDQPGQTELKYQHFSVVMSRSRRLPFFTAVNIDGQHVVRLKRSDDKWQFDPRIPKDAQMGPAIYSGVDLDFGHLVRRLDPTWGDLHTAQRADIDTFHYTNCAPQHKNLNRNKTTWAGLEDYILQQAMADQDRLTVFTGPVFGPTDPVFRGVLLPDRFWKLVVMHKRDGMFSASAYLLSQAELIADIVAEGAEKRLTEAEARTFQIPVYRLERLTRLTFDDLVRHDPLLRGVKSLEDVPDIPLHTLNDIQL
jgi:endonuclease G